MKSNDQQHLQEAYASVHKETHYNTSMNTNQSSSKVYGLFLDDEERDTLLGIYFREGEAVAARAQYIEEEVSGFQPTEHAFARKHFDTAVYVVQLPVGSKPDFKFVKR
jgi:hypothetical protein